MRIEISETAMWTIIIVTFLLCTTFSEHNGKKVEKQAPVQVASPVTTASH